MGCSVVPELDFDEFTSSFNRIAAERRIPQAGSIEVTDRCNLNCKHCYINLPANDRVARSTELSSDELFRILDALADAGCMWLLLTGGDPFLRPDFLDIYTHAKKKGLLLTVFTNGTMITPKIADHFVEWPPYGIEITLYGMSEDTYEAVTGLRGSYKKCIQGIELLHEREVPLKLKAVGLTINQHEIPAMRAYAKSLELKEFLVDYQINPRLNGSRIPCNYRIDAKEVMALEMTDPRYLPELREYESKARGWEENREADENLYDCGAGITGFHIDSYGRMSLCEISRLNSYDLRTGSFAEGWNFLLGARTKPKPRDFLCDQCEIEYMCDQCPGWSEMTHGVLDKPVDFLCELTHRRAAELGIYPENPVLDLRRLDREQEDPSRTIIPLRVVA